MVCVCVRARAHVIDECERTGRVAVWTGSCIPQPLLTPVSYREKEYSAKPLLTSMYRYRTASSNSHQFLSFYPYYLKNHTYLRTHTHTLKHTHTQHTHTHTRTYAHSQTHADTFDRLVARKNTLVLGAEPPVVS